MRYFIKAYPMHEREVGMLMEEAGTGAVVADIGDGLVVGTADGAAIERLAAQGVVLQTLGVVPDEGAEPLAADDELDARVTEGRVFDDLVGRLEVRPPKTSLPLPDTGPAYWLADVVTGITDDSMGMIEAAGAEIVEREPSGAFVIRTTDGGAGLLRLPFVQNVRLYGVDETLSAPVVIEETLDAAAGEAADPITTRNATIDRPSVGVSVEPGLSSGRFEAICHERSDLDGVTEAIGNLGGSIISSSGRAVRFVLNPADIASVAAIPGVASVAMARSAHLRCDLARPLVGIGHPDLPPLSFDGAGETIGVADTGIDAGHPDFAAKHVTAVALGRRGDASDPDGHGTHVAGTIAGDGTASRAQGAPPNDPAPLRGIAPAANIYFQSILDANGGLGGLPDSLIDLLQPAYDAGVRIHNNSWGAYIQSRYDSMALDIDEFVYSHPDFLPIIAAGNEGSCRPGLASMQGFVDYPSLGSPATAKNGITVGASRSSRTKGGLAAMTWQKAWPKDFDALPIGDETVSGDAQCLAAFSSRGPADDFRVKPDLVAPGTDIAATRSRLAPLSNFWGAYPNNRHYAFMGGTSMACPIVTGCAALVRQFYRNGGAVTEPSAALIKATLINGTTELNGKDAIASPDGKPNYHQGFGRVDLARSIPNPDAPAFELFCVDTWKHKPAFRFVNRKGRFRWEFLVVAACEIRIALVWTDYPGRAVQNQLRMILDTRKDGRTVNWIGNANAPAFVKFASHDPTVILPGQENVLTRDPQNNVQIIRAQVEPGSHMLALFADGLIKLPQDFALVATYPVGAVKVEVA
ncbi:MAG: S8 family serine peptidase [Agrobacterium tumefaciens]|nr:S8 family serine peptidase [Agrobacterium tumefaciens]